MEVGPAKSDSCHFRWDCVRVNGASTEDRTTTLEFGQRWFHYYYTLRVLCSLSRLIYTRFMKELVDKWDNTSCMTESPILHFRVPFFRFFDRKLSYPQAIQIVCTFKWKFWAFGRWSKFFPSSKTIQGIRKILSTISKINKIPQDSFRLVQEQSTRSCRDLFKLLQKPDTRDLRDSFRLHISRIKHKGYPRFFQIMYFITKTSIAQDSFKLLQKPDSWSPRDSFKVLQKQNKKRPRDSLKLLQKPDTSGALDSLRLLQK